MNHIARRDFIRLVGGGVVLAAAPGCAPSTADARAAWNEPGAGERDPRKRALSYAILAPNPHNMQPWLADLTEPGQITLYIDTTRMLPVTDPFNRQIVIGCGAFLELLRMAAAQEGMTATIEPFPAGEPLPRLDKRPVARVRLGRGAGPDPLFAHVLARRTNRGAFDERAVPESVAKAVVLAAAVPLVTSGHALDAERVAKLKALVFEGAKIEANTPPAHQESVDRTFIGKRDVAAHRYGISLEGPVIEGVHAVGLLTQEKMKQPGTFAFDQSLSFLKKAADTSRGFVWMTTAGDSRAEQLAAGAAYVRANLAATGLGLAMHPWSQLLQEYETQNTPRAAVHRELAPEGGRIQMLARIGYARPVPPAPRRGLAANVGRP
jgi:hypothetical protein